MDGERLHVTDPGHGLLKPPRNNEAERALLGTLLMANQQYDRVSDFLSADHFADPTNALVYRLIGQKIAKGEQANPITLKAEAESDDLLRGAGGIKYLVSLAKLAVTRVNAGEYARILVDLSVRRETIDLLEIKLSELYRPDPDVPASAIIEETETHLMGLATGDTEGGFKDFRHHINAAISGIEKAYQHHGEVIGLPTGLIDLDQKLGGLWPRELYVVGGRPGMGKTTLITTMLFNIARYLKTTERPDHKGGCAAVFSLEMGGEELAARILCARAGVSFENTRLGKVTQEQVSTLVIAGQELAELPIYIDDTPALSVGAMVSRARRLSRKMKLKVAMIDYLGLAEVDDKRANRTQQLGQVTRNCKKMAKALDMPVVALAQLSRKVEERDDKRPQLSDLRDSGEIEEHADSVCFLYRHQYYLERQEPQRETDESDVDFTNRYGGWQREVESSLNKAEFIVAKNRHGKIGTVKLHFDAETMQFGDLFDQPAPAAARDPYGAGSLL